MTIKSLERFAKKFTITEDCWEWTGSVGGTGYGTAWVDGRFEGAHRASYKLIHGSIPDGLQIDHLCRNRKCVKPDHLEAVTFLENVRRGNAGKQNRELTHCPKGHEYNEKNTRWYENRRYCRPCDNIRSIKRNAIRKAQNE